MTQGERSIYTTGHVCAGTLILLYLGVRLLSIWHPLPQSTFWTHELDPVIGASWLGSFCCYLALPRRPHLAWVVGLGLLAEALLFLGRPVLFPDTPRFHTIGMGLGAAAMGGLAWRALQAYGVERAQALGLLSLSLFLPLMAPVIALYHSLVEATNPMVYDQFGFVLDGLRGFHPAMAVARFVADHPVLDRVTFYVYVELPLASAAATVLAFRTPRAFYQNSLVSFIVVSCLGSALYNFIPMVGCPWVMGPAFPYGPDFTLASPPAWVPAPLDMARNCMPSVHMATALVIVFTVSRLNRKMALAGWLFAFLTALSTMRWGAHYLIDLAPGFPLALIAVAVSAWSRPHNRNIRLLAGGAGGCMLAVYLLSVRFAFVWLTTHVALFEAAQIALVLVSVWLETLLARETLARAPLD